MLMDNSHLNFAVRTLPLVVGEDEGEKESEDGIEGESEHGTEDEGESEDDGEQLEPRGLRAPVLVFVLAVLPSSLARVRGGLFRESRSSGDNHGDGHEDEDERELVFQVEGEDSEEGGREVKVEDRDADESELEPSEREPRPSPGARRGSGHLWRALVGSGESTHLKP
ncbi:hypothetical protein C8Q76DRAFT_689227 [Earliella scabrosa]|nr:hypothetical protein C8Q76DRAFT_689227 [Earliella scabrosa]